jgi:hypothetical protein
MSNINDKFTKWSPAEAEQEFTDQQQEGGGNAYMKLVVGRNVVRILPAGPDGTSPFHRVWQHFLTKADGSMVAFECPWRGKSREGRQPCPVCEEANRLDKSGNPLDRDAARKLWPSRRAYANVVDRLDPDAGVKILAVGKMIYEELLGIAKDEDAGGDFSDPIGGFDIVIGRVGTGQTDTRYSTKAARDNTPLAESDEAIEELLDQRHNLVQAVRALSFDEMLELAQEAAPRPAMTAGRNAGRLPAPRGAQTSQQRATTSVREMAAPAPRQRRTAQDDALDTES